ncbi:MAG: glucosaminidase domain-containing protein [Phaeodactylibacter xiamenensis]|uniref:glucosaminidase domain-containing protein n=1 Tax=Phaeodactylibacter xiamenensis TaxID=1524460 RepID=UPI00126A5159|nr:glucosaminidase domain-containing protein [Phaeodactylibacter xiamenensis]MCR9054587.1 glucosaminidase domain-containing protein [bacterium]
MNLINETNIRQLAYKTGQETSLAIQKHWLKTALLGAAAYMALQKDMVIDLQLNRSAAAVVQPQATARPMAQTVAFREPATKARAMNTSLVEQQASKTETTAAKSAPGTNVSNLANTYSNLTAANKGEARKESATDRRSKRQKQKAYVKRFAKVARMEMDKYGIPASITLAQGLLESNVGESKLATRNNNHFGMKCFSKSCSKGHCSNFTDDSHKDFFRIYKSAWESFRAHSLLLKQSSRYQPLFQLKSNDYKGWARGLKKAGYATDPKYAEKIINLIEDLDLHQYDR